MSVEQAKEVLKANGYFVDNLWHVDDVKLRYNCDDDEVAQDVLNRALTNDATMEQVWFALDMVAQDEGLELVDDEDRKFVDENLEEFKKIAEQLKKK
jgi:hypothetical protein